MTTRVAVTLSCDAGWSPDCHDTCRAEEDTLLGALEAARRAAATAGWVKRWFGPITATVCPACAAEGGYPQTVIEPHVVVTVRCDSWLADGCHREYAAIGEPAPVTGDHVREEAATAGWTRKFLPHQLFTMDVCPACRGLKGSPRTPEFMFMS